MMGKVTKMMSNIGETPWLLDDRLDPDLRFPDRTPPGHGRMASEGGLKGFQRFRLSDPFFGPNRWWRDAVAPRRPTTLPSGFQPEHRPGPRPHGRMAKAVARRRRRWRR